MGCLSRPPCLLWVRPLEEIETHSTSIPDLSCPSSRKTPPIPVSTEPPSVRVNGGLPRFHGGCVESAESSAFLETHLSNPAGDPGSFGYGSKVSGTRVGRPRFRSGMVGDGTEETPHLVYYDGRVPTERVTNVPGSGERPDPPTTTGGLSRPLSPLAVREILLLRYTRCWMWR